MNQIVVNQTQTSVKHLKFVHISDTHNRHDHIFGSLVPGDVLVHTGDFSDKGSVEEIKAANEFLGRARKHYGYKYVVAIAGNHDWCLDPANYPEINEELPKLLSNVTHYLNNSFVVIEGVKIYGTPNSNAGPAYYSRNLEEIWKAIPDDTDVLLTHMPPKNILDLAWNPKQESTDVCEQCHQSHKYYEHWGSGYLAQHIFKRVKPKVHMFGHVHDEYGSVMKQDVWFINSALKWKPMRLPQTFDYYISQKEIDQRASQYQFGLVYPTTLAKPKQSSYKIESAFLRNHVITAGTNGIICAPEKTANDADQRWILTSDGYIQLESTLEVIDIDRANASAGATLVLWKKLHAKNQRWKLVDNSIITSIMNGYAMDVNTHSKSGEIIMYPVHKNLNQQWIFKKCD